MKLYVAAILAISFLDLFNEGIVRGSFGSQMMPWSQCTHLYTEEVNIRRISSYEEHERPVKAIVFITNNGIRVCVQHDLPWVQKTIKKLNQRPKPGSGKKTKPSPKSNVMSTSRSKARTS